MLDEGHWSGQGMLAEMELPFDTEKDKRHLDTGSNSLLWMDSGEVGTKNLSTRRQGDM